MNILQKFWNQTGEKYARKQAHDLALYVVFAVALRPGLLQEPLLLARYAATWVLRHGTPTADDVRRDLTV